MIIQIDVRGNNACSTIRRFTTVLNLLVTLVVIIGMLAASPVRGQMTFNFVEGTELSNLSSTNPALYNQVIGGFEEAGEIWSSVYVDPITINMSINFENLGAGILGSTGSETVGVSLRNVRNAVNADVLSPDDAAAAANLPNKNFLDFRTNDAAGNIIIDSNKTGNNRTLDVNRANGKALGLVSATSTLSDGSISFSDQFSWDFDRSDGISGGYDFVGVAGHEIGHLLGFVSGVDIVDITSGSGPLPQSLDGFRVFSVLDLYRYSDESLAAGGLNDYATGGTPFFSIDGGATELTTFSTGSFNGDGRQASHWKDNLAIGMMDPTLSFGEFADVTRFDYMAFDVMGYDLGGVIWGEGKDGDFETTMNWLGGAAPTGSDHAIFHPAATYTTGFAADAQSDQATVRRGSVTWNLGTNTYDLLNASSGTPSLVVGQFGSAAALTLTGGVVNTKYVKLGDSSGDVASLIVASSAILNVAHTLSANVGGALQLQVGGAAVINTIDLTSGGSVGLNGGRLTVNTLIGSLTNTAGTLAPGTSPGTTLITGSYTQLIGGVIELEVGDMDLADHDVVNISGNAQLGGTLDLLALPAFSPVLDDQVTLLNASTVLGHFNIVTNVVIDAQLGNAIIYNPASVDLRISLRGDVDFDDDVDSRDITTALINYTGAGGSGQQWTRGDFDGDGDIDTGDLTAAIINFSGASDGLTILPDLIYDDATGGVTINTNGADIIAFDLQGDAMIAAGALGAADFDDLSVGIEQSAAGQVGWTSYDLLAGLNGKADLGAILPAGLDRAGVHAAFADATFGLSMTEGGGGGSFNIIIPEPASLLLMGLGAMMFGYRSNSRRRLA